MYYKMPCPHCGKNLKFREEHIGRKARCPYCRETAELKAELAVLQEEPSRYAPSPPPAPAPASGAEPSAGSGTATVGEPAPAPAPAQPEPGATTHEGIRPKGTNVSLLLTGAMAVALAAVFYVLILPLHKTYIGELFLNRGWVPPVIVFLSCWSGAVLAFKSRELARQRDSVLFDVLPTELSLEIRPDNVDQFSAHIRSLPCDPLHSFLLNRVLRALEHFKSRASVQEVASLLSSQGEIDANAVESSYTMVKVFIWAIPILGFIGTVIGIGSAVGSFSQSLRPPKTAVAPAPAAAPAAGDPQGMDRIKDSLGKVTRGLGVAFDTTLLALVMSIIIMFPTSSMQKSEEDILNSIDEYCNDNVLGRLAEPDEDGASMAQRLKEAVDAAMATHEAELRRMASHLDSIGGKVTDQVVQGWEKIHRKIQDSHQRQVQQIRDAQQAPAEQLGNMVKQISETAERVQEQIARLQQTQADQFRGVGQSLVESERQLGEHVAAFTHVLQNNDKLAEVQQTLASNLQVLTTSDAFSSALGGMQETLERLQPILETLNERVEGLPAVPAHQPPDDGPHDDGESADEADRDEQPQSEEASPAEPASPSAVWDAAEVDEALSETGEPRTVLVEPEDAPPAGPQPGLGRRIWRRLRGRGHDG